MVFLLHIPWLSLFTLKHSKENHSTFLTLTPSISLQPQLLKDKPVKLQSNLPLQARLMDGLQTRAGNTGDAKKLGKHRTKHLPVTFKRLNKRLWDITSLNPNPLNRVRSLPS